MSDIEPNADFAANFTEGAVKVFRQSKFMCLMRHYHQRKRYRLGRPRMVSVRMLPRKSYRVRVYEYRRDYKS